MAGGAVGKSTLGREDSAKIDHLSCLLSELLLDVFEHLRAITDGGTQNSIRLIPLSRSLHQFQRISLYKLIKIYNRKTLLRLYSSVKKTGLGYLIRTLDVRFGDSPLSEELDRSLTGFSDHLPQLRGITTSGSRSLSSWFMSNISEFKQLRKLDIRLASGDAIHLKKLLNLDRLREVKIFMEPQRMSIMTEILGVDREAAVGERLKHLTTFDMAGSLDSPLVLEFIGSVAAEDVRLSSSTINSALSAVSSTTISLALTELGKPLGTFDPQLLVHRFTHLQHITFGGGGIKISSSLLTRFLSSPSANSLTSLIFGRDFNLNAEDLIAGLSPATSAPQLRWIELDSLMGFEHYASRPRNESYSIGRFDFEDMDKLMQIGSTGPRRIKFTGRAVAVYEEIKLQEEELDRIRVLEDERSAEAGANMWRVAMGALPST